MRIFLVSNMYPSKEYPNYGVFVKNTEEILKDNGWEISKAVMYKQTNKIAKMIHYIMYYLKIILKGLFLKNDLIYVHYASHNAYPLLFLKRLKNVKIYVNVHGSDVVPEVASQEKYQPYVKKLLSCSTKVIAPSNYYKELVSEKFGINKDKIFVFPSGGVNKNTFRVMENKDTIRQELQLSAEYNYIGFVGRIDVGKGWDIFLEAYKAVKDTGAYDQTKMLIVGKGAQQKEFEDRIDRLGLRSDLVYFPLLPQSQLAQVYNCLELFCFPTTRKGESLGLVGLEAMACGVPVIGSRIGGLKDYIQDQVNGLFFEPGDSNALARQLEKYSQLSKDEQDKMKEHALITAEGYEVNNIKQTLVEIFKR